MAFITPITDRTLQDVQTAKTLSDANQLTGYHNVDLKGCINASDFNRLSNNLTWIKQNIPIFQYPQPPIPDTWVRGLFLNPYDALNNYEKNIYYLKDYYLLSLFYPDADFGEKEVFGETDRKSLGWQKVNQWERIMIYLYNFIYKNTNTWRDVLNNYTSWRDVLNKNESWGALLK